MAKWNRMLGAAALSLLALAAGAAEAGGGGGGHGACAGYAATQVIIMRDSCFEGTAQFVPAGSTINVFNEGEVPHSLSFVDGTYDTGNLDSGDRAEFAVGEAGVVRYYCKLHGTAKGEGMAGVIIVGEAGAPSAARAQPGLAAAWGWLGAGLGGAGLALLIVRFRPR
jgi:plastocyanin